MIARLARAGSLAGLAAILGLIPAASRAQSVPAAPTMPASTTVFSIQPISLMLTVYAAELEHALSPTVTVGVGGTNVGGGIIDADFNYTSGDVKLRYYPDAKPFQGFSFGGSVGVTHVSGRSGSDRGSATGGSLGILLDYNWLLGAKKNFYVGVGAGAKTLFISDQSVSNSLTLRYPTGRLSVGFAF